MSLDWTKEQRYDGPDKCPYCKGRGWHFDQHFHHGGTPGVCGHCGCTGRRLRLHEGGWP